MTAILLWKGASLTPLKAPRVATLLALISLAGGLRMVFVFTSFTRLPLGDSTTILFSSPVLVMLLSTFLLGERCGLLRVVAASSLLAGVTLISKPPVLFTSSSGPGYDLVGYTLVLAACCMSALGVVLTKLIASRVEKAWVLLGMGLAITASSLAALAALGHPRLLLPATDWLLCLAIGLLGLLQQYVMVWAVTLESPSIVTCIRCLG